MIRLEKKYWFLVLSLSLSTITNYSFSFYSIPVMILLPMKNEKKTFFEIWNKSNYKSIQTNKWNRFHTIPSKYNINLRRAMNFNYFIMVDCEKPQQLRKYIFLPSQEMYQVPAFKFMSLHKFLFRFNKNITFDDTVTILMMILMMTMVYDKFYIFFYHYSDEMEKL